jgi:hypothetical protein
MISAGVGKPVPGEQMLAHISVSRHKMGTSRLDFETWNLCGRSTRRKEK